MKEAEDESDQIAGFTSKPHSDQPMPNFSMSAGVVTAM